MAFYKPGEDWLWLKMKYVWSRKKKLKIITKALEPHIQKMYREENLTNFKKISIWLRKIKCSITTVIDSPLYIHTNKHIYTYIYISIQHIYMHTHGQLWKQLGYIIITCILNENSLSPHNISLKACPVILSNLLFLTRSVKLHVLIVVSRNILQCGVFFS